ncbi:MAG: UMP kinase [Parachlamydiaceae bacterium]
MSKDKRKTLLLKLSGEVLLGSQPFGIDAEACRRLASILQGIHADHRLAIVVGAGNLFRGLSLSQLGMPRTSADHIGMLATMMNGIALQQALERIGCQAKVLSALDCPKVVESYSWRQAKEYLDKDQIVLFAGGTGNPYFTTDTAAALRASEVKADYFLKATKVDGIYDKDPLKFSQAKRFSELSYDQFLVKNLQVMDATAVTLCKNSKIPILVFNMAHLRHCSIEQLIEDKNLATIIKDE